MQCLPHRICSLLASLILVLPILLSSALANTADTFCGQLPIPATAITLQQSFQLAVEKSEVLKRNAADLKGAEARYRQILSAIYPEITLTASERFQSGSGFSGNQSGSAFQNDGQFRSNSKDKFRGAIGVAQPIFTGFREELLSGAAKAEIRALSLENSRAEQLLYLDVAEVFYQIILYRADVQEIAKTDVALKERIEELQHWQKLGKSRESELLAAQADRAELLASQAQDTGLLNASQELFDFLVGEPGHFPYLSTCKPIIVTDVSHYIELAQQRPDVKAQQERIDSAEKQIVAARRERWPSLRFEGNYYPIQAPSSDNDNDWDATLRFELPLFDGGLRAARVEERLTILENNRLALQQIERTTERDVRKAYSDVVSARNESKELQKLVDFTKRNYESQRKDYELGVVTNLEVLQAIRQMRDARRRFIDSEVRAFLNTERLKIAAGEISL